MTKKFSKSGVLVTWAAVFTLGLSGCGSSEPVASSTPAGGTDTMSQPGSPSAESSAGPEAGSGSGSAGYPGSEGDPSAAGSGASAEYGEPAAAYGSPEEGADPTGSGYPGSGYSDPAMAYEGSSGDYPDAAMGYGETGYPGGGYGSGNAAAGGGPLGLGTQMLTSSLAAATQIEAARFPDDYWGQAELAFKQGYDELASKLLLAHLAAEPAAAAAADRYNQVRFSRPLGKPTWFVRWGLSISVRTPDGFTGDVSPITGNMRGGGQAGGSYGSESYGSESYGSESYGSGGPGSSYGLSEGPMPTEAMGSPGNPADAGAAPASGLAEISLAEIDANLGLFATLTADYFEKRFAAGDFGPAFASLVPKPLAEEPQPNANGAGMYGSAGYPGMDPSASLGSEYPGGSSEMYGGAYGEGSSGMYGGSGGMYGGAGQQAPAAAVPPVPALPKPHPRWRPGVVYLGQLDYQQAIEQAKEAGIDFLIHFDVKVDQRRRTEDVVNETRARVVNVRSPEKPAALSRKLSNMDVKNRIRVQEAAQQRSGGGTSGDGTAPAGEDVPRAMVSEALAPMFDAIDRDLKLIEMPPLSEPQVRARVGNLIAGGASSPLAAMAEFQLYRFRGQLSEADMVSATELLLGDDGLRLLVGSEPVRREVMASLQPRLTAYGELGMEPPQPEPAK